MHAKLDELLVRVAPVQQMDTMVKCESAAEVRSVEVSVQKANSAATSAPMTSSAEANEKEAHSAGT